MMPTSDPTEILLAHDRWASRQILDACAPLSQEQFHQRFDIGPGSLHDTIAHIYGAMSRWTDLLAGREFGPRLEGANRSVAELISLHDVVTTGFSTLAKSHPFDGLVTRQRDGKTYTFTRGAVIAHVTTHGMHHRAQCLNMLRRVGVTSLPPSSVMEWSIMADTQQ